MSVDTSENGLTVLDAFRVACITHCVPYFFYTDNGPGYANAMSTKEGTGVLTLLGVICKTSIPGRPQGKGLMERAVKTIHTDLAKRFASCVHRDMDQTRPDVPACPTKTSKNMESPSSCLHLACSSRLCVPH